MASRVLTALHRRILIAARRDISQRKFRLLQDLRAAHQSGELAAGELAPSVRDLARKYELSSGLVAQQVQVLVGEGLFYTVSGAGTFVGRRRPESAEFYLFVLAGARREMELKTGFEEEIARRGGTTLIMTPEQVVESVRRELLPVLAGIYLFRGVDEDPVKAALAAAGQTPPEVNFDDLRQNTTGADVVNFDDVDGGRQAAQHLRRGGHREIAFLAIHAEHDAFNCSWSARRLDGWRSVLQRDGIDTQLAFLPSECALYSRPESAGLLREAARRLLEEAGATAVVAANDDAALQLIQACRDTLAPQDWPAIVSFDGTLPRENNVLTSLRLPWEELGRLSAATLWERAHNQITGARVHRMTPLRMIPRLTCNANWSLVENLQTTF